MQLIAGEIVVLAVLIQISNYIRKRYAVLESILRGCVVFFPPEKGNDNKNITFVQIDDKFSIKSPYFADAELLVIVVYLTVGLTFISGILEYNPWITMGTSVSFYMLLMGISVVLFGLYKQSTQTGLTHPENLLSLLMSLILFFTYAIILNSDHQKYLDFNINLAVQLLNLQISSSLKQYLPNTFKINVDYFIISIILSLYAAFALYPTFRYISKYVTGYSDCSNDLRKKIYAGILVSPLILSTLWVKPMLKDQVSGFLHDYFAVFRILIVLLVFIVKLFNLRYEIQCMLNQSIKLAQDVLMHPNKENLESCTRKCRIIATMSWPVAHQSMCCAVYILLLTMLLVSKGSIFEPYPTEVTTMISYEKNVAGLDEDEFLFTSNEPLLITKNVTYIEDIRMLEEALSKTPESNQTTILENIASISRKTLVHPVFYRDISEFFLWATLFGWTLATVFNFILLNVVPTKTKVKAA